MMNWWLKQVKDFILKFSIGGISFSEKELVNLCIMTSVSFPSGECVDEAVDNWTNYQGYKYVNVLWNHTFSHNFMGGEGVC